MGISKVGSETSGVGNKTYNFDVRGKGKGKGKGRRKGKGNESSSGDEYDDSSLADANCELAMVEGRFCSIPYELYDLNDLKEILSLDTWNSCLTEEERFMLSAYLPDMDHETFVFTMRELLGGGDLYFGNPVQSFFKRLKGGLYPPEVARSKESLHFLQHIKYYHSLKSYHDNMIKVFEDMINLYEKRHRIGNRVFMWSERRKHQKLQLLDIDKVPSKGYPLGREVNLNATCQLSGMRKSMKCKTSDNPSTSLPPKGCLKSILKTKASKSTVSQNHNPTKQCKIVPKGILKVLPKITATPTEQSNAVPSFTWPIPLIGARGSQEYKSPPSTKDIAGHVEVPSLWQKVGRSNAYIDTELPKCVLNQQDTTLRSIKDTERSIREIKREMDSELVHSGVHTMLGSIGERNFSRLCDSSSDMVDARRYGITSGNLLRNPGSLVHKKEHISIHPRHLETVPRNSDLNMPVQRTLMSSVSNSMNCQTDVSDTKSQILLGKSRESEGIAGDHIFPLTYKRRKTLTKLNSMDKNAGGV